MHAPLRRIAVLLLAGLVLCSAGPASGQGKDKAGAKDDKGKDVPRDNKVNVDLDHIFKGGINRNGDLYGIHHYPSAPKEMTVDGKKCKVEFFFQDKGGPKEVTTARIEVRDVETKEVLRKKFSTLYPAGWSKDEVEKAVREAYQHAQDKDNVEDDGKWGGQCGAGFRIEGYVTRDKKTIITAFPIFMRK